MNVMVMDVEGTDGRERGEDQVHFTIWCWILACASTDDIVIQDFERKSALFSLASSEILIVNLWEHQVGLYQGANMGLLKTVFEVNLGLFGKKAVDGLVQPPSHLSIHLFPNIFTARKAAPSCSSSSVTILAQPHSQISKQP